MDSVVLTEDQKQALDKLAEQNRIEREQREVREFERKRQAGYNRSLAKASRLREAKRMEAIERIDRLVDELATAIGEAVKHADDHKLPTVQLTPAQTLKRISIRLARTLHTASMVRGNPAGSPGRFGIFNWKLVEYAGSEVGNPVSWVDRERAIVEKLIADIEEEANV